MSRNVVFIENKFIKDFNCDNKDKDNLIFYDVLTNNNDENNVSNSSQIIADNDNNLNSNDISNELCDTNQQNSKISSCNDTNDDSSVISGDGEQFYSPCSVRDTSSASSSPGEVSGEPDSQRGGAAGALAQRMTSPVEEVASQIEEDARPIRSTRGKPPQRYGDYKLDFDSDTSMLAYDVGEPFSYTDAMSSSDRLEWQAAMQSEYDSLINNNVWKLVDRPPNENVIKCKWVYKKKHDASGNFDKFKARLVARGFTQVQGVDFHETFSPVVRHSTMRILFSLANELDLNIDHIDVTTAFLNGDLTETIYMEQPPGFDNGDKNKVCLLLKGIYGLKQASRIWNLRVHTLLSSHGYKQSKCEPCVYVKKQNEQITIIALYVDDFYIFYSSKENELLPILEDNFDVRNLGALKSCLGINVTRDRAKGILKLDQTDYIKKLLIQFGMENCKAVSTPMPVSCKLEKASDESLCDQTYNYRQLLGSLNYLSVSTRMDISFACSQLGQFNSCFGLSHWQAAKRILRYLAGTINYSLNFVKGGELSLCAYTDADWANCVTDRKSYTGYIVKLGRNTINWESRKQRCVALSSTEAEYIAISDVCKDVCFIRNFLSEIVHDLPSTIVYNDNQSAQKLLEIREYSHKRTKHIDLRYHFVKDLVKNGVICVKYLETNKMIADVLTKALSTVKHVEFVKCMSLY